MNAPAPVADRHRLPLDVAAYLCLNDAGLLRATRTELIDGEILLMNPQYRPHARAKQRMVYRLQVALLLVGSSLEALTEASVVLSQVDMPLPDIVLTNEAEGTGPIPLASVALLVEVADTTVGFDLGTKAAIYARHRIPEYWVVDLDRRRIVGHSGPSDRGYAVVAATAFGDPMGAATIPGLSVATDGLD